MGADSFQLFLAMYLDVTVFVRAADAFLRFA
jgi:hypothetical protein